MNYTTSGRHEPRPIRFVARPEGAGGDDKSGRAQSACREATCVNASRELQSGKKTANALSAFRGTATSSSSQGGREDEWRDER